ncbi:hypothetical protein ACFL6U_20735 [Planctomycetota bacterium]
MKVRCIGSCVLVVLFLTTGCITRAYKGYGGPELPPQEVALVALDNGAGLMGVDNTQHPKPLYWSTTTTISLTPGQHIIKLTPAPRYNLYVEGCNVASLGGYRVIDMEVKAGHKYHIKNKLLEGTKPLENLWATWVINSTNGKQVEAVIYDGMLTPGTPSFPQIPYRRNLEKGETKGS